jgi:homoserine O-succinyltransferase
MSPLKAGFLNMMADKAFVVSERHFATLLGTDEGREVDLVRLTFDEIPRGPAVAAHIARHYRTPAEVDPRDLDVLVISGAYVSDPVLSRQVFWEPLCRLFDWAGRRRTDGLGRGVPVTAGGR